MPAKMGVLGLIMSFYPCLRSAIVRFPLPAATAVVIFFSDGDTKNIFLPIKKNMSPPSY